jgi:thiamine biosynthesis lipoprotein
MKLSFEKTPDFFRATFDAMASTCEVLIDSDDEPSARDAARRAAHRAANETARIEAAFSRYRDDNTIHAINNSGGEPVRVDDELADLLDFADRCWHLSDGRFDITSGVLRRVWRFDGSDRVPEPPEVEAVIGDVGWDTVSWERPVIRLRAGMEIDLGGFGKEYAVDRALALAVEKTDSPVLVNLGGDLAASAPRRDGSLWQAGVENPDAGGEAVQAIGLGGGGLATSGDAQRYLVKDGVRYGHILDPTTGWPVAGAPRSVTVHAASCTEAGLLATLATLEGPDAEAFLEAQGGRHWCLR